MMNREGATRWERDGRQLPHPPQDMEKVLVYFNTERH